MPFPWQKKKQKKAERGVEPRGTATAKPIRPEDWVGADQSKNEETVREGFVAKAKAHLGKVPMADEIVALYFCFLDGRTPLWVKGVAAAALAYFILPLDAIPDILPLIGLGDDLGVLSATLAALAAYVTQEHRAKARVWLRSEKIIDVTPGTSARL